MTREERDTIRAQCKEAAQLHCPADFKSCCNIVEGYTGIASRLLNELDDSDKRNHHTIDCYIGEFEERKRAQADRDRWKSRAEHAEEMLREYEPTEWQAFIAEIDRWRARVLALERAVRNTYDAPSTGCALCVHREERRVCYSGCRDKSLWQFDEARFSEPQKGGMGL